MSDFIPPPDDEFNDFMAILGTAVTDPANPLKLSTNVVAQWNAAVTAWSPAWSGWQALAPAVEAALQAKSGARTLGEAAARAVNNAAQADHTVSDPAKAAAGLPVHKATRTPIGRPVTAPMVVRLDNEHLLQRLWFADSTTPGSRAKPDGVATCEIRQLIQAANLPAPTDPEEMPLLAIDSKPPHRTDFDAEDVDQKAYYALRWRNAKGQEGPWSAVSGYLVN